MLAVCERGVCADQFYSELKVDRVTAVELFSVIDTDGNGTISHDELVRALSILEIHGCVFFLFFWRGKRRESVRACA